MRLRFRLVYKFVERRKPLHESVRVFDGIVGVNCGDRATQV